MKKRFVHIIDICMFIFILGLIVYLVLTVTCWKEPNLLETLKCEDFSDGWERVYPDGTREGIALNSDVYAGAGEALIIEKTLPENVEDNLYLGFRAKRQTARVFVDGELRTDISLENGYRDVGKVVSRYVFVNLRREDAGRVVRIEGVKSSAGERKLTKIYYGEKSGIITRYLKSQAVAVGVAIVFVIVGILSIILGFALRIATKNEVRTDYIGWAMLLISIWDFAQSDFRDFFFNNISMVSIASTISLLIISIPMALFLNFIQRGRYKKIYFGILTVITIDVPIIMFLVSIKVINFSTALIPAFVALFGLAAVFLVLVYVDKKNNNLCKEYKSITIGAICVAGGGAIQTFMFYTPRESDNGTFLCLGMLALTISSFAYAFSYVYRMSNEKTAAELAAAAKTQFLATMSHEIRTPINGVLGMNEAIRRETTEENIRNYADDVNTAGNLLLTLVNDILDLTKLESGKMTLLQEPYKIREIVDFSMEMIEKKAIDKGLKLEADVDATFPSVLKGDEVRVKQIMINLLNNAVKYTEKGKISFKLAYKEVVDSRILMSIIVSDTGRGIKNEDLERLFTAFTRVDEAKNSKIEGTGLGLVIVSRLIDLMGGTIHVDSTYGAGSTFTVTLPIEVVDKTPIGEYSIEDVGKEHVHKEIETFTAEGLKTLVVDDVDMNIRVFKAVLKDSKMEIDSVMSGDECIQITKDKKYDIIFLDHMMPGKDGVATLKEIRASSSNPNRETPIIVMTANALEGAREEYLKMGFNDYVSKPFKISDIERVVEKILEEK